MSGNGIELLTTSARDYAENQGVDITSFRMVGLSATSTYSQSDSGNILVRKAVESGCEVVTDIRYHATRGGLLTEGKHCTLGTGLKRTT